MKRKALGRGLSALLPEGPIEPEPSKEVTKNLETKEIVNLHVDTIEANQEQPRSSFNQEKLDELAESIKKHGVLQPLLVRVHPESIRRFVLIAGERRWRAAKQIGLETVPCLVLHTLEAQSYEISLIENIQRSDLSPIEEAKAYHHLMNRFSLTQDEVSQRVGKSRESIANALRLMNLPEVVQYMLHDGEIAPGHAKSLLALKTEEDIQQFALRVVEEKLTVRDLERLIKDRLTPQQPQTQPKPAKQEEQKDVFIEDMEHVLQSTLQTKVRINMKGKNKGTISIDFFDLDQLDSLLKKWNIKL